MQEGAKCPYCQAPARPTGVFNGLNKPEAYKWRCDNGHVFSLNKRGGE